MITNDKQAAFIDDVIDGSTGWATWFAATGGIRIKPFGTSSRVDSKRAVLKYDTFAAKSNDTFDDILLPVGKIVECRVLEYDNLPSGGDVRLVLQLSPRDRQPVDNQAVTGVHRGFHAWTFNIEAAEDKRIDKKSAENNADNKDDDTKGIFKTLMALKELIEH